MEPPVGGVGRVRKIWWFPLEKRVDKRGCLSSIEVSLDRLHEVDEGTSGITPFGRKAGTDCFEKQRNQYECVLSDQAGQLSFFYGENERVVVNTSNKPGCDLDKAGLLVHGSYSLSSNNWVQPATEMEVWMVRRGEMNSRGQGEGHDTGEEDSGVSDDLESLSDEGNGSGERASSDNDLAPEDSGNLEGSQRMNRWEQGGGAEGASVNSGSWGPVSGQLPFSGVQQGRESLRETSIYGMGGHSSWGLMPTRGSGGRGF
ncbi:MAG: hypothetical protein ACPG5T_09775, partial [Endozoicomonas sp.]